MLRLLAITAIAATGVTALAVPSPVLPTAPTPPSTAAASSPTVKLSYATYSGSSSDGINSFLGMRFAEPPVGPLRYNLPVQPPSNQGDAVIDATSYGNGCIAQQLVDGFGEGIPSSVINTAYGLYPPASGVSEDCLFVNVIAPAEIPAGGLPVIVWIYGGGFEFGSTSSSQSGEPIVARSIATGSPVIYVSMNYRLAAYGFLPGKEIKDAKVGNLGLYDQRAALEWVQTFIVKFGGDKTKVTAWGESAGAISVALQMLYDGGKDHGLFRGAFLMSGSPTPVGSILQGQPVYDKIVELTGCSGSPDTLACLREVPTANLTHAMDQTPALFAYNSLDLAYLPRVDDVFLTLPPLEAVRQKKFNKQVAIISTDCDDEATLFSLSMANTTTDQDALDYIKRFYIPKITDDELARLDQLYPRDPVVGSPFDTGVLNQLYLQFKRLASFQGDLVFQGPRRWFLEHAAPQQPVWAGLYKRGKATPFLGSFHSSDLSNEFYTAEVGAANYEYMDYIVSFVRTLDPNSDNTALHWPQYTVGKLGTFKMLTFLDAPIAGGLQGLAVTFDTYRKDAMNFLISLSLKYIV